MTVNRSKVKNILISGGAGFIGSNLALSLIEKGFQVRVLDNLSPQIHGSNPIETSPLYQSIVGKVDFINGTVTSPEDWRRAIYGQDAIIHLAAETGTGQSMYEIKKYCDVNIGGTALLMDLLTNEKHTIKKIVVASSRAIYGEGKYQCALHGTVYPDARISKNMIKGDFECKCPICGKKVQLLPTSEDSKLHPISIYGITKQNQEQIVFASSYAIGIPSVVFRYQNVYGPGQSLSNPYTGILSIFSAQIKRNSNINVFEDGKESRDFVFIEDAVNATINGLENEMANYKTLNVGYGKSISVEDVARLLIETYNSKTGIYISGNFRLGDIRHNYADILRMKEILGFAPKWEFAKGIIKFAEWVNKQQITDDGLSNSFIELKERGLLK